MASPHVVICFQPDGQTNLYPEGAMDRECAERFARLVELLHEQPELILCALRLCAGADAEAGCVH